MPADEDKKEEEVKEEEAVVEVKTKTTEEKPSEETTKEEANTKSSDVSSFSQLDTDAETEKKEEVKESEEKDSETDATEKTDTSTSPDEVEKTEGAEKKDEKSNEEAQKWLSDTPGGELEKKGRFNLKFFVFAIIIAAILGVIVGGFLYYRSRTTEVPEKVDTTKEETTTTEPTPTEVPVEEEEIDPADYLISILNGSGVPGEAGKVQALLEEVKFSEIETGNAQSYDFLATEVSMKEGIPNSVFTLVEEALETNYLVVLSKTVLDADSTYDVIIIVGSQEPEATPTPVKSEEELTPTEKASEDKVGI